MPMDGITIGAVVTELNAKLAGSRIEKVLHPEKDELVLLLRNGGENFRLILSANANFARIHITEVIKSNPLSAPMFCMLLRKHLTGGKLIQIIQLGNERIVELHIDSTDEFGELTPKRLILEIMGRHSNIILINSQNFIVDSIKHINLSISRVRQVLPGGEYFSPPSQGKLEPIYNADKQLMNEVLENKDNIPIVQLLTENFIGVSNVIAKEIAFNSVKRNLESAFYEYMQNVIDKKFLPCLMLDQYGTPIDFFPFKYNMFAEAKLEEYKSISKTLDQFFLMRDKTQRQKERSKELHNRLTSILDRLEKKKKGQQEKLKECKDMDILRVYGELLLANLYNVKRGEKSVQVSNYYLPNNDTIDVPLDLALSPNANAQKYFKRYAKLKTASALLASQITENDSKIDYLQSQLENLDKCTEVQEVQEIRFELATQGYINNFIIKKGEKKIESKPLHYISSDGIDIYVGKNNTQNDLLTLHFASSDNMWLHTKAIHGSHVIIRFTGQPPQNTLQEAAMLAAYYSKARASANVPVDATLRKFVKKPSGSLPGKVIYVNNTTIIVTPSEDTILKLKIVK